MFFVSDTISIPHSIVKGYTLHMLEIALCPECNKNIDPQWFFCANCGSALREKTISISLQMQLFIYAISFFLAPLGLIWVLKYIRSADPKTKKIGVTIIILTIISLILMITVFKVAIDQYTKLLNAVVNGKGYF